MSIKYLNLTEFAERVNIERDTLAKYKLPPADGLVGDRRGWLESTIDHWNANRPGRGNWGPKIKKDPSVA
jgi:predicted DNA-binding transcriptional regulator AlpA